MLRPESGFIYTVRRKCSIVLQWIYTNRLAVYCERVNLIAVSILLFPCGKDFRSPPR